jgi:hypothetical protein
MTTQPPRPALNNGPDPSQDGPEPQPTPSRSAHLRSLVQALIAFASTLVDNLAAPAHPNADAAIARRFGTTNLALITARITRGLLMAMALNRRLARVAQQLDKPAAQNTSVRAIALSTKPAQPRAPRPPAPQPDADDAALLARLPTAEEIAGQIRHRPIGRVIEDICRDLGILPSDPLWQQLQLPIIINGGNLVRLFKQVSKRVTCRDSYPMPAHAPKLQIATGPP